MTNPCSRTTIGPLSPVSSYSIVPADSSISGMCSPFLCSCANRCARHGLLYVVVWLPGLACPLASPTCFLGTEQGSQVLIPVAPETAAEGQTSSQGALFVFSPIVSYRSYCKGKMILCANEEV